jgi:hypothetical protein
MAIKITDLIIWQVNVSLISAILLSSYSLWLSKRKTDGWKYSPSIVALSCIGIGSILSAIGIDIFSFPDAYAASIRYINDREYTATAMVYAHAIIVSSLAIKLAVSCFLAMRFSGNLAGLLIAFVALWLAGAISSTLLRELALQGWLRRLTQAQVELLPYMIELALYTLLVIVVGLSDVMILAAKISIRETKSIRESRFGLIVTVLLFGMVVPLLGFLFLSPWGGVLLFVYLWLALPMILAFAMAMLSNEPFTPRLLVEMFSAMINAVSQIVQAIVAMFRTIARMLRP